MFLSALAPTSFASLAIISPDVAGWVNMGIGIFLSIVCYVFCVLSFKKKVTTIFFTVAYLLLIAGIVLDLWPLIVFPLAAIVVICIVGFVTNAGSVHEFFDDPKKYHSGKKLEKENVKAAKTGLQTNSEDSYRSESFYQKMNAAVRKLADTKTGALITIEKKIPLDNDAKSGTILDAPLVPELLETIFYNGSRLHDGGVIIRGETILAASCYYKPTDRPISGKFGARHRAAVGMSERNDSVTVVISEETGRISIAYKGEIYAVRKDDFVPTLKRLLTE